MIAFLFPNQDYTAADLSTRVQAMAAMRGLKVYSPPRNFNLSAYRQVDVARKLSQCRFALFAAHDVQVLDDLSREELARLTASGTQVYSIVPSGMVDGLRDAGLTEHVYAYHPGRESELPAIVKQIMDAAAGPGREKGKATPGGNGRELGLFLLFVGLLALLIAAFATDEK